MRDATAAKMIEAEKAAEAARQEARSQSAVPPAGPHAKPHLTNKAATPGSGALPSTESPEREVDGGVG